MKLGFSLAAMLALLACTPPQPMPLSDHNACNKARYQGLLGQNRSAVDAVDFGTQPVRVFQEGAPVTLDFQPNRLNFAVSRLGRVVAITCG